MNTAIAIALSLLSNPSYRGPESIRVGTDTVCYRNDRNHAACVTVREGRRTSMHHYRTQSLRNGRGGSIGRRHHSHVIRTVRLTSREIASLGTDMLSDSVSLLGIL